MPVPSENDWLRVSAVYFERICSANFIGNLDGKHCCIKCPSKVMSLFYDYNQYDSLVLLAIADSDCTYIFIDVGVCGKESESSVFQDSVFEEALLSNVSVINIPDGEFKFLDFDTETSLVIAADEAFPLHETLSLA
jgi:hypothetical protein